MKQQRDRARKQAWLTQAVVSPDDDAAAALQLAELRTPGAEQAALAKERAALAGHVAARVSHERLIAELEADVLWWTHMREYQLQHTSVAAKRMVQAELDVTVRLNPVSVEPRYDVTTVKPPDRSNRGPNPTGLRNYWCAAAGSGTLFHAGHPTPVEWCGQ